LIFFEGKQTTRRLLSLKVSGRPFQRRFFAMPPLGGEFTKNAALERMRLNPQRKAGGGWPAFL
jgi:hypothetical protein